MRVDLHTHTTASDGELDPHALLEMQVAAGVELLAITDHDTLDGWDVLRATRPAAAIRLIPGIELSACDGRQEIHVVGLGFDPAHPVLRELIRSQSKRRCERAQHIADRLQRMGIADTLDAARRIAGGAIPGRRHFARVLVASGRVPDMNAAFRRYLGAGKPASVAHDWPPLAAAVSVIRTSGGRAVLAHPHAYGSSPKQLRELVRRFADCGGDAMEVALPGLRPDQSRELAECARRHGLLASAGSDFHAPAQFWRLPCKVPALPAGVIPVWHDWVA